MGVCVRVCCPTARRLRCGRRCNSYSAENANYGAPAYRNANGACSYLVSTPPSSTYCTKVGSNQQRICPCYVQHRPPLPPSPLPPGLVPPPPPPSPVPSPPPAFSSGYPASRCSTTLTHVDIKLHLQPIGSFDCSTTCTLVGATCIRPDYAIYGQSCVQKAAVHFGLTCAVPPAPRRRAAPPCCVAVLRGWGGVGGWVG